MYIPSRYREESRRELAAFMERNSFAAIVSVSEGQPVATHLPLSVTHNGTDIILKGHFAKANPQWRLLDNSEMLVIFTGPHAYVSPMLYDRRDSVPTWNYQTVHAYGQARIISGAEDTAALLAELILQNDPAYLEQWNSLPDRYRDGMMQGIVGFELLVTRIEGAAKLSQNRSLADQQRVAASLLQSEDPAARATGAEMQRRLLEGQD
jgi:transcriptional regulator